METNNNVTSNNSETQKISSVDNDFVLPKQNIGLTNTSSQSRQYLAQQTESNTREIEIMKDELIKMKKELVSERSNNYTIFGIFASLLTFLSVEIQIFKNIDNLWTILGFTSFLLSSLLIFILCIHFILKDKLTWIDFLKSPIFWLFIVFLFISMMFLLIDKQGIIEINIKI